MVNDDEAHHCHSLKAEMCVFTNGRNTAATLCVIIGLKACSM